LRRAVVERTMAGNPKWEIHPTMAIPRPTGKPLDRPRRAARSAPCALIAVAAACIAGSIVADATRGEWKIETVAGNGKPDRGPAGRALDVQIGDPFGVVFGPDGRLYVTEVRNHRVWAVDLAKGDAVVVAGNGTKGYSGDGGPATSAQLNEPYEVRFDAEGNMFFVEMRNHLVRRVDAGTGVISTVAGTGQAGFSGDDGLAVEARFDHPHSIVLDGKAGLYVADIGNHRVRRVDLTSGVVTTIAGNGEKKLPIDGQTAVARPLLGPRALWFDHDTFWIALREGHSVWTMNVRESTLHPLAGTGRRGFSGDGGPARSATFDGPKGIALDTRGNVYVVDTENHALRRIDAQSGAIETIAGGGPKSAGYGGDGGPGPLARLNRPHGICVGPDGSVYTGDTLNHRVRRVHFE